jgi:DHA1 family tetracycline resistance protein-like MFS transporter
VSCVLIAAGSGLSTPSVSSYVSRNAEAHVQGLMLGTLQSLSALARVLGPAVGGLLYQTWAPPAPYLAGAVGLGAAAWLSLRLSSLARTAKTGINPTADAPPSGA